MSSHALVESPWLPKASCGSHCHTADPVATRRTVLALRMTGRIICAIVLLASVPLLAIPLPGR